MMLQLEVRQNTESEQLKRVFCQVMVEVAQRIPDSATQAQILDVTPAMPHLAEVALALSDWLTDDDLAWPYGGLGRFYREQGSHAQAAHWFGRCLAVCRDRLGDAHPDVAQSLNNLALLYDHQGRYGEAEPLLQQALALRQRLLGEEHPDVAQSLNNLTSLYDHQRRYGEAELLYQAALAMFQQLLGDAHPDMATSLNNLASLYDHQGRYGEAEP